MNSKQLNFFIVPQDLATIYAFFNEHDIYYVKKSTMGMDSGNIKLERFPYLGTPFEQIYLSSQTFKSNSNLILDRTSDSYALDIDKSYILQFNPGGFYPASSKILHRGRFYCTTSYFVSNREIVGKGDDFKNWVDFIFKLFKKKFLIKLGDQKNILFSPNTIEWMREKNGKVDTSHLKITIS